MLKLIVAPPGAGKTTFITERIRKAAVNQGAKQNLPPFLIVPEQSHFETERMIYQTLGAQTACNTEVLSFTKLAAKIITESRKDKAYASDTVREIGMFGAVAAVKDRLVFYKTASEKADFASRMLGAASVFQREGISPQDLAESAAEIESTRLKSKIADLALIYESYMESLSENFSDRQDEIRTAANIALETDFFEGRKIYIDGFDGFTGSQLLLLEAIIRGSKEATVTLTADKPDSAHIHYITTVKLTEKLKETAVRCRINAEIVVLNPLNTCGRTPEETETFLFPDTFAESNFVAAKIRELITCHNYFLNDIAVLNAPSPETLMSAFSAYGISAFADLPESVIEKPMVRFIITVLEAVLGIKGALLTLIKSGFIRVSGETAFRNTVKVNALRKVTGKRTYDYARPEKKSYRIGREMIKRLTSAAYEWQMEEADWYMPFPKESRFEPAERIRAEIVSEISALCERIKNTTGDKITEELSDFLINKMELGRTVADIVYRGEKVSSALNDEYRNLWETVISIFEAMHSALKNKEISIADYTVILKSVFGKTKTAKPPQVLDAVTVGDLRRTRVSGIKVVFLMGANQGECPKSIFSGAEFSAQETEKLCLAGIFIEENKSERYYRERFMLHRAVTLPTEKLYITAPLKDTAWKEKQPVRSVFISKEKITAAKKNAAALPLSFWTSHRNALAFTASEKRGDASLRRALKEVNLPEYKRLFGTDGSANQNKNYLHVIQPQDSVTLMKKPHISPARIETLNTCLFKYFCLQGLKIANRRVLNPAEPDALVRGEMVHYVLEKVLRETGADNYKGFIGINPNEFEEIAEKALRRFEAEKYPNGWARSVRKKAVLLAHAAGIAEVLKQMRDDMEASDFRPFAFEKKFEFMFGGISVNGKTDRLDMFEDGGHNHRYIRVIDYKTGGKKFKFPEIEFGLNMQALIYLFAAASMGENLTPSGAFYRLVNGGKLSKDCKDYGADINSSLNPVNPRDLYKNRMETQSMTGIQFGGESRPDYRDIEVINSRIKANLPYARTDFIKAFNLSEHEYNQLFEKTAKQLKEKLNALYGGDVRAVPVHSGDSPCIYCEYKGICGNAGKREEVVIQ